MERSKLNQVILTLKSKVSEIGMQTLVNALKDANDSVYEQILMLKLKSPKVTILLAVFLGIFGADRFYLKNTGLGVAKLLLGWATCGIWVIIDMLLSHRTCKEKNLVTLLNTITIHNTIAE